MNGFIISFKKFLDDKKVICVLLVLAAEPSVLVTPFIHLTFFLQLP